MPKNRQKNQPRRRRSNCIHAYEGGGRYAPPPFFVSASANRYLPEKARLHMTKFLFELTDLPDLFYIKRLDYAVTERFL